MSSSLLTLFLFFALSIVAQAVVPPNSTFVIVNEGEFGEYDTEYGANYRLLGDFQSNGFALCFYNTTPNAYTFGIRMGQRPEDSTFNIMMWVWAANRGSPVKDNATLTFGANGNLVLADADGSVKWQTRTANQGVVGISILPNGNLVLVNSQGGYVWQSFDYPTDTLLVGQGLRRGGSTALISRVSDADGSNGPYSLVLEQSRLAMYLTSKNSPTPILYYTPGAFDGSVIDAVVFNSAAETEEAVAYGLHYEYYMDNSTSPATVRLARLKYDSTLSFLRIESDGNLRIYTYYDRVITGSWETTFTLFNRVGTRRVSECRLPARCGTLGVCENNQCVGCPTRNGLLWWNATCAPPTLPSCRQGQAKDVKYFKVEGVESFMQEYTDGVGPITVSECRGRCNRDCGCLGFFYKEESSMCLLAPVLGTLTKVANESHVAYIRRS